MNNDDHLLTLKIDAYIKGQLSDVEHQKFENDMRTDAKLVECVRTQRAELALLDLIAEEDLRQKVRKWSAQMGKDDNNPPKPWWRHPLSILAFLGGIVVLVFIFFPKKTTTNPAIQVSPNTEKTDTTQSTPTSNNLPKIDTTNKVDPSTQNAKKPIAAIENAPFKNDLLAFVEDMNRTTERGNTTTDPLPTSSGSAISIAMQFIQNQNFTPARNLLKGINPQSVNYADAQFLLATIDYLQNKPKMAAKSFKILSEMDGYIRKEPSAYYWAISLVANGQTTEAKKILVQIAADTEHPKHDAATVLLKSL